MGWVLINNATRQRLRLRPGSIQIGRAAAAHIRPNHQSVSRNHAEISVALHSGSLSEVAKVGIHLIDRSSTGHTFVNGQPSGRGAHRPLAEGDTVAFGIDNPTFTVQWMPTVFSWSSRVLPEEVERMERLARAAGAFMMSEWTSQCTHLITEQLAITPKLLCCVSTGGVPVSTSYLEALAVAEFACIAPDPLSHQPLPPVGNDAAYAGELERYARAPRSRKGLFDGVWVIYGSKLGLDGLGKALSQANLQVQIPCFSVEQCTQVSAEINKCRSNQIAVPREVWVVPPLEEAVKAALGALLPSLRQATCLTVPVQAVVRGIFVGSREAVHTTPGAVSFTLDATGQSSLPATQKQEPQPPSLPAASLAQAAPVAPATAVKRRRAMPWGQQDENMVKAEKREDTVDLTQEQEPLAAPVVRPPAATLTEPKEMNGIKRPHAALEEQEQHSAAPAVQTRPASLAAAVQTRPASLAPAVQTLPASLAANGHIQPPGWPPGTALKEPKEVNGVKQPRTAMEAPGRPKRAQSAENMQAALTLMKEPDSHEGQQTGVVDCGPPQTVLSTGATSKLEENKDDKEFKPPPGPPATVGSSYGGAPISQAPAPEAESGIPKCLSISFDTPFSQPKPEIVAMKEEAKMLKVEGQQGVRTAPMLQRAQTVHTLQTVQAEQSQLVKHEEPAPEPVVHPTGTWLKSLGMPKQERPAVRVDNVEIMQAAWQAGAVPVTAARIAESSTPARQHNGIRSGMGARGFARRNFKLFQKGVGQRRPAVEIVPVAPWVPPQEPDLGNLFNSQSLTFESQSQLPPV